MKIMKHSMLVMGLLLTAPLFAKQAQAKAWSRPYGMAGCGLGSVAMGKHGGQVSAATTNGSFYSQLFGITSGTLNCVDAPKADMAGKMDSYLRVNSGLVAMDMARGSGEHLDSLASIVGCQDKAEFSKLLHDNFSAIYKPAENKTMDVTDSIINVLLENKSVMNKCTQMAVFG